MGWNEADAEGLLTVATLEFEEAHRAIRVSMSRIGGNRHRSRCVASPPL